LAHEALVEASTAALAAEDAALKVAAMGRRVAAAEGLPSMERTRVAVSSAVQVKNYVLGVKAAYALPTGATALLKAPRPSEAARAAGATDVDACDRRRRRHGYPTLPGFQEKGAMDARAEPKDHLRVLADLNLARSGGGLVRTLVGNGFNGQDDEMRVASRPARTAACGCGTCSPGGSLRRSRAIRRR